MSTSNDSVEDLRLLNTKAVAGTVLQNQLALGLFNDPPSQMTARPFKSKIHEIPPEVMTLIFSEVVGWITNGQQTPLWIHPGHKGRPHPLLILGLVCRQWREYTVETGRFWAAVSIDLHNLFTHPYVFKPLDTALKRSKGCKLDIVVRFHIEDINDWSPAHMIRVRPRFPGKGFHLLVIDRLLMETRRWSRVQLYAPVAVLRYVLSQPRHELCQLNTLTLKVPWLLREAPSSNCVVHPTLLGPHPLSARKLEMDSILLIPTPPMPQLVHLDMALDVFTERVVYDTLALLRNCLGLEHLFFNISEPPLPRYPRILQLRVLGLSRLRWLRVRWMQPPQSELTSLMLVALFTCLVLPSLVKIDLDGSIRPSTIDALHAMIKRSGFPPIQSLQLQDQYFLPENAPSKEKWSDALISLFPSTPNISDLDLIFAHLDVLSAELVRRMTFMEDREVLLPQLQAFTFDLHDEAAGGQLDKLMEMLLSRTTPRIAPERAGTLQPLTFLYMMSYGGVGKAIKSAIESLRNAGVSVDLEMQDVFDPRAARVEDESEEDRA